MVNTTTKIVPVEKEQSEKKLTLPPVLPQSAKYLFNRDLSLIEFFRQVLDEGLDAAQPLLERLKFLSIFSSNVDEFFMIRVSGLKERFERNAELSPDGMSPQQQLAEIRRRLTEMTESQMQCIREEILPQLEISGISIIKYDTLDDEQRAKLDNYFKEKIYPILTPQAVDPSHPFPYISGGSINLGLMVKPKVSFRIARKLFNSTDRFFCRLKIPSFIPRFIPVGKDSEKFVLVEDLVSANISRLIPDAHTEDCHLFRVTRDADLELREEEAEDLLQSMEQNLRQRRLGDAVRLEIEATMPQEMTDYLKASLDIHSDDVYVLDGAIKLSDFMALYKLDRPDLKDEPLRLFVPPVFNSEESMFDLIKQQDILLHHPYMPYSIVTDFFKEAVEDPNVLAIKMCLYRTGADSPIPPLLIEACERGKQVTVLIELKARFDEENNIEWAKRLERAGVHVVYGILGLKTHCKTSFVVRREGNQLRRYTHLATGNYNPETSAFYTDLGVLTADKKTGADATKLFNFLTAYSQPEKFGKLLVAPINLREKMIEFIKRETVNAGKGKPARIIAKMNRLADTTIIHALYEASQAGVEIDLIVRGVCMLRPGVPGLSENIRVRSIVGRLLEHSRAYYFANGGEEAIYIGSSDWMPRNLDRRVEVLTPLHDERLKSFITDDYLPAFLKDNVKARLLMPDGSYRRVQAGAGEEPFDSQMYFQGKANVIKFDTGY